MLNLYPDLLTTVSMMIDEFSLTHFKLIIDNKLIISELFSNNNLLLFIRYFKSSTHFPIVFCKSLSCIYQTIKILLCVELTSLLRLTNFLILSRCWRHWLRIAVISESFNVKKVEFKRLVFILIMTLFTYFFRLTCA